MEYNSKGGDQEILWKFQKNIYRRVAIPGDRNIRKPPEITTSEDNMRSK